MIKALVLEVIKKIHLIITFILLVVLSYAIVNLILYETFEKVNDGSKVFEVRHNINDIVDDSHITVSCRIILPLSILCFVMSVLGLVAVTLYKRTSRKNYLAV